MAFTSNATRLESRSFDFYFIYILLLLSSDLFSLCYSIPRTLRLCLLVTYQYWQEERKRRSEISLPNSTFFNIFFYIPLYTVLKGNLLFRSGINLSRESSVNLKF